MKTGNDIDKQIKKGYKIYKKYKKRKNYVEWEQRINDFLDQKKEEKNVFEINLKGVLENKLRERKSTKEMILGIQLPMLGVLISILIAMTGLAENVMTDGEEVYNEIDEIKEVQVAHENQGDEMEVLQQKQENVLDKLERFENNIYFLKEMYLEIYIGAVLISFVCCVIVIRSNAKIDFYEAYIQVLEKRKHEEYEKKHRFYMEILV